MSTTMEVFYLKNDNALRATVTDSDGAADEGATVTATVVDRSGTAVQSALAMGHVSAGMYQVVLNETLYERGVYTAQITVVGTGNEDGYIELRFQAQTRRA
jgi:hypothetical protein